MASDEEKVPIRQIDHYHFEVCPAECDVYWKFVKEYPLRLRLMGLAPRPKECETCTREKEVFDR